MVTFDHVKHSVIISQK